MDKSLRGCFFLKHSVDIYQDIELTLLWKVVVHFGVC